MIKLLVILCTIKCCILAEPWHVGIPEPYAKHQHSPEDDAAAIAQHEAAVKKAKAEIASAIHQQTQEIHKNAWMLQNYAPKYTGPVAKPSGYDNTGAPLPVMDTPEVANAKVKLLAALSKAGGAIEPAKPKLSTGNHDSYAWQSPPKPWSMQSNHFLAQTQSTSNQWPKPSSTQSSQPWPLSNYAPSMMKYTGPIALPPGYDETGAPLPVQDTPEVEAEKAKHFNAYSRIAAASKSGYMMGFHGNW